MEETNQLQPQDNNLSADAQNTTVTENNTSATTADMPAEQPTQSTAAEISDEHPQPAEPQSDTPSEQPQQTEKESETAETEAAQQPFEEPQTDYSNYTRQQLVEALKELLQYDIPQIRNRVLAIKQNYAEKTAAEKATTNETPDPSDETGNKKTKDPIAEQYNALYSQYRKKRIQYNQDTENQKLRNLDLKKALLDELKQLIDSNDTLKKSHDQFNAIQEKWKSIGDVPRSEINNLWNNYHFLIEQFFAKVKISKELRDIDLKRNLERKLELCEKTEALIMEPSVNKAFKQLQEYREQWREAGPVPSDQNEEIWQRFRAASEKIDQRRREHYANMQEEMNQNLLAKTEICQKAEALANTPQQSLKEWAEKTTEMEELLKLWKTIGPVPREHSDEIWHNFTAQMTKFYDSKKEYVSQVRSEQSENYNRKVDICIKAENIAQNTTNEWSKATAEILALQKEWKTIGSVNKKMSEKVWLRFRSACDNFFERKTQYYNSRKDQGEENVRKRQALIDELRNCTFGDDNKKNLEILQNYQRQWSEMGYTPAEKKTQLQNEFRDIVNQHLDELKIDSLTFFGDNKNKDIHMSPEMIRKLSDDIQKLKNDVSVWENNLGFLANSKQADLLKEEFERKIQSTRQKIALIEAKLKAASVKPKPPQNKNGGQQS